MSFALLYFITFNILQLFKFIRTQFNVDLDELSEQGFGHYAIFWHSINEKHNNNIMSHICIDIFQVTVSGLLHSNPTIKLASNCKGKSGIIKYTKC